MVTYIEHEGTLYAIIVSHRFNKRGVHFLTPGNLSQQLAYMRHDKGKTIDPHVHNLVKREVYYTQEVLIIKKGRLRVDFYDENREYLESRILTEGDVILLIKGGHGFEALDDLEMIEVKQGPYQSDDDKTRFDGISSDRITVRGEDDGPVDTGE